MGNPMSLTIQRGKLYEQIASHIEETILSGTFSPGDKMPTERALGEQLGVSRTVIREAFQVLNHRGLVHIKHGSGIYVRKLDPNDIAEPIRRFLRFRENSQTFQNLCEVRHALELNIAGIAAERATDKDIAAMETAIEWMIEHAEDAEEFSKGDLDFHSALATATQNDLFSVLLSPISDLLLEFRLSGYEYDPEETVRIGARQHRRIMKNIKKGNIEGARVAMGKHLEQAQSLFQRALDQNKESDAQ